MVIMEQGKNEKETVEGMTCSLWMNHRGYGKKSMVCCFEELMLFIDIAVMEDNRRCVKKVDT